MEKRFSSKLPIKHPGELFRSRFLERYNISVQDAATKLHIHRGSLTRFLNGQSTVSIELALKLEVATRVSAKFWLSWQNDYDLQRIEDLRQLKIDAEPLLN